MKFFTCLLVVTSVFVLGCSDDSPNSENEVTNPEMSPSLVTADGREIPSESLSCIYRESTGASDEVSLQLLYNSSPDTLAFYLIITDPVPAIPYTAAAGEQGSFEFWTYLDNVGYRGTLSDGEVEVQLDSLPSPSSLSDGDVVELNGELVISSFSLSQRDATSETDGSFLDLAADQIDIDCSATFQRIETVI